MTARKYRQHTKESKLHAIQLAETSDKSASQVARELGIRVNQIYKWKKELGVRQADAFPAYCRPTASRAA